MGTFNFYLQQATNATAVQIANIGYKLATTGVSRLIWPVPVPTLSWLGFAISVLGIALFTFAPKVPTSAELHAHPFSSVFA